MSDIFPIVFDAAPQKKALSQDGPTGPHLAGGDPSPWPWATHPSVLVELLAADNQECHRFRLAEIKNWPEVKTTFELRCITAFGKRMCTKVPVVSHRTCTKFAYVDVCYPKGGLDDIKSCVGSAALAAAVSAIITGGAAAGPTFKAALEACLLAKGARWANEIGVSANWDSECGDWH